MATSTIKNYGTRTLLAQGVPSASTEYNLADSVQNYREIEIILRKSGKTGAFVSRRMSVDDLGVGYAEDISLSTYNSGTYNLYLEGGFASNTKFGISTYRCSGWTMSHIFIVGIS